MRIVDLETFLGLPAGVVFSKYEPIIFGSLCIKGDSIPEARDFFYQDITEAVDGNLIDLANDLENGRTVAMDLDCMSRDGCFADDQLFAVWDRQDVEQLVSRFTVALEQGYPTGKPTIEEADGFA